MVSTLNSEKAKPETQIPDSINKLLDEIYSIRGMIHVNLVHNKHSSSPDEDRKKQLAELRFSLSEYIKKLAEEIRKSRSKKSILKKLAPEIMISSIYFRAVVATENRETLESLFRDEKLNKVEDLKKLFTREDPVFKYFTEEELATIFIEVATNQNHLERVVKNVLFSTIEQSYAIKYPGFFIYDTPRLKTVLNFKSLKKILSNCFSGYPNMVCNSAGFIYLLLFSDPEKRKEIEDILNLRKIINPEDLELRKALNLWKEMKVLTLFYDAFIREDREAIEQVEKALKTQTKMKICDAFLRDRFSHSSLVKELVKKSVNNLFRAVEKHRLFVKRDRLESTGWSNLCFNRDIEREIITCLNSEFKKVTDIYIELVENLPHVSDIIKERDFPSSLEEITKEISYIPDILIALENTEYALNLSVLKPLTHYENFFERSHSNKSYIEMLRGYMEILKEEAERKDSLPECLLTIFFARSQDEESSIRIKNNSTFDDVVLAGLYRIKSSFEKIIKKISEKSLDNRELFIWHVTKVPHEYLYYLYHPDIIETPLGAPGNLDDEPDYSDEEYIFKKYFASERNLAMEKVLINRINKRIRSIIETSGYNDIQSIIELRMDLSFFYLKDRETYVLARKKINGATLSEFTKYYLLGNAKSLFEPIKDKQDTSSGSSEKSEEREKITDILSFIILEKVIRLLGYTKSIAFSQKSEDFLLPKINLSRVSGSTLKQLIIHLALVKVLTGRNYLVEICSGEYPESYIRVPVKEIIELCYFSGRRLAKVLTFTDHKQRQ